MELSSLEAFVAVAKQGSFSAAAKKLNLTQPAVSKRVASLEQQLATPLFNRVAKSISLTAAGERLMPKAQALLQQAQDMQRYALTLKQAVTGRLSMVMSDYIAGYRMVQVLQAFAQRFPQVKLDICFASATEAQQLLENQQVELALFSLPPSHNQSIETKTIWHDSLVYVVANNHPLANQDQPSLEQLSKFDCALPAANYEIYRMVKHTFTEQGLTVSVANQNDNLESIKALVKAGLVWSVLPESMFDNSLVKLPIRNSLSREVVVGFSDQKKLSNAAQQMLITLEEFVD